MLLKELKADPNVANFAGDTPLHKAVAENHLNMIKLLVEVHPLLRLAQTIVLINYVQSGAKVDVPNKKKQKPTDMCKSKDAKNILAMPQKGTRDPLKLLLTLVLIALNIVKELDIDLSDIADEGDVDSD